jgi:hypothetical protein
MLVYEALQLYKQNELTPSQRTEFETFSASLFETCNPKMRRFDFLRLLEAGLCHSGEFNLHEDVTVKFIHRLQKDVIEYNIKHNGGYPFVSLVQILEYLGVVDTNVARHVKRDFKYNNLYMTKYEYVTIFCVINALILFYNKESSYKTKNIIRQCMTNVIDICHVIEVQFTSNPLLTIKIQDSSLKTVNELLTNGEVKKVVMDKYLFRNNLEWMNTLHMVQTLYTQKNFKFDVSYRDYRYEDSNQNVLFCDILSPPSPHEKINNHMVILFTRSSYYFMTPEIPILYDYVIDYAILSIKYTEGMNHVILATYCDGVPILYDSNQDYVLEIDWKKGALQNNQEFRRYITKPKSFSDYAIDYVVYVREDIYTSALSRTDSLCDTSFTYLPRDRRNVPFPKSVRTRKRKRPEDTSSDLLKEFDSLHIHKKPRGTR